MYKLIGLIVFLGIFFILSVQPWKSSKKSTVEIKGNKIDVEFAQTPAERAKGLMYRSELGENNGMLFVFPTTAKHAFWMANTYIPLDILWLDSDKKIVHIEKQVPPCTETGNLKAICKTYAPDIPAKYVLEVNAGYVDAKGINVDDNVIF